MRSGTGDGLVFGKLLRGYRAAAGLTQVVLAERAGMSVRGLSDLERGARREPAPDTVERLATALGLSDAERAALLATGRRQRGTHAPLRSAGCIPREPALGWPGAVLPVALTSFIGRDADVAALLQLLERTRLLTLTGPGGIGKTRLAIEVAGGSDVAVLVELGPIGDPDMVAGAIGASLGAREQAGEPHLQTLANTIGSHQLLLVIDNCEHVIARCAELAHQLLQMCAGLRILATSREPLSITGEVAWRVPSLSLPEPLRDGDTSALGASSAVQLFLERATAAQPDFALTPANAAEVVQICQGLDGIPLALELAAARLPALGVAGIALRLGDRFRLLSLGPRSAPPRQRTLAATIDWSYALLGERERAVFRRLSVFARGFTLEAAESVCAAPPPPVRIAPDDIVDLVSALVAKSLVMAVPSVDGTVRYRLLETLRAYAAVHLTEHDDVTTRDRHAAFFLRLALPAEVALRGAGQAAWLARLEQEHDNFRAALAWYLERGDTTEALQLSAALTRFWLVRGYLEEGIVWLERALGRSTLPTAAPERIDALAGAGVLAWHRGDYDRSEAHLREALALANARPDRRRAGLAHYELAKVATSRGEHDLARGLAEQALEHWQALGDVWGKAVTLNLLGELAREQREFVAARGLYEESRGLFEQAEDQRGVAITSHNLGIVAAEQGAYARAIGMHRAALALKRDLGDREGMICTLINLAWLAWRTGDVSNAPRLCGSADAGRAAIGAVLPAYERELYARTLALAVTALGEQRCSVLLALGRAMDLDSAIAAALSPAPVTESGPVELSPRERQVASLVARGLSNRQIAQLLMVGSRTVESHVGSSLAKLGLASRAHLAAWAVEHGLTDG